MLQLSPPSLLDFLCGAPTDLPTNPFQPVSRFQVPLSDRYPPDLEQDTLLEALGPLGRQAFDNLYALAADADDELVEILRDLSDRVGYPLLLAPAISLVRAALDDKGGVIIKARAKRKKRALEKIFTSYAGFPALLTDIVRCSIAVDRCVEFFTVAAALRDMRLTVASLPKDRFATPKRSGYRDLEAHIRLNCGVIAEVQIHLKSFLRIKEIGPPGSSRSEHDLYEEIRTIDAKAASEDREPTPEELQRVEVLRAQANAWYSSAWLKAGRCGTYAQS